jgi:hypothetical protein
MKVFFTRKQAEAILWALDNHLDGDKYDRMAIWLTDGMIRAARNARGILSCALKRRGKK